jgi:hypothetical protein
MRLQRYDQLFHGLAPMACRFLVEVGTWNGNRAKDLIDAALERNPAVTYHGFDLFEALTDQDLKEELSKRPPSEAEVSASLDRHRRKWQVRSALMPWRRRTFSFELHRGYTRDSLPRFAAERPDFRADFIFIDGGHAVETIENDWRYCSAFLAPGGEIYLDDYYGRESLTDRFGCNQLVDSLRSKPEWEVTVLPATDTFPDIGTIQIVRVRRKS